MERYRGVLALISLLAAFPPATRGAAASGGGAIPAFARKYHTSCLTCHVMPPRLNALGEAFRLNGYQFPNGDALLVRDSAVALGAPETGDLFPGEVWPGTIPGSPPIALRMILDYESRANANSNFVFPAQIQLLTGGTFSEGLGFFGEVDLAQGAVVSIAQAYAKFQNLLRFAGLPPRTLNAWVGKFDQNLLPSYRSLESIYRAAPAWAVTGIQDLRVDSAGVDHTSATQFRPVNRQPGVELNGILGHRFGYAVGVVQGVEAAHDVDGYKDTYYAVRLKLGGMALDGALDRHAGAGGGGRWVDDAIQLEHFGYFGRQQDDPFRRFGLAAKVSHGNLDVVGGYVWGRDDAPWASPGTANIDTWFALADYIVFPWLLTSVRVEDVQIVAALPAGWEVSSGGAQDRQRVIPSVVMLVRSNIRLVLEREQYLREAAFADDLRPHAFGMRLDFAF